MSALLTILKELKQQNVSVQLHDDNLKLMGEVKSLSASQIDLIKSNKKELIELLGKKSGLNRTSIPNLNHDEHTSFRLSQNQEGVWFLNQLSGSETDYNVPFSVVLSGDVNEDLLELAINKSIAEFSSLRMIFFEKDGVPYQIVQEKVVIDLKRIELGSTENNDASVIESNLSNTQFDLEKGPLIRSCIADLNADNKLLSLCVHHLVIDGWSFGLLFQSIIANYKGLIGKDDNQKNADCRISYSDYVHWISNKEEADINISKEFWKNHIQSSEGKGVVFPYISDEAIILSERKGERIYFSLEENLTEKVEKYCRQQAITPFDFYFSIYNMLLYKFNSGNEFVVGVPFASRRHKDLFSLFGFVTNVLAINTKISGDESFNKIFSHVSNFHKSAEKHQSYPLTELKKALQTEGELGSEKLFNTLFTFQNMQVVNRNTSLSDDFKLMSPQPFRKNNRAENVGSKFDVSFQMGYDFDGIFNLEIEYLTNRYSRERIIELSKAFIRLAEAALKDDSELIGNIEILTQEDRDALYNGINKTIPVVEHESIVQVLNDSLSKVNKDKIAIWDEKNSLSYGTLIRATDNLAYKIQEAQNTEIGSKVGILCERNANAIISILGTLKSGCSYVPIDINYPKERIKYLINDASPALILADDKGLLILQDLGIEEKVLSIQEVSRSTGELKPREIGDLRNQIAYLIYTSGSTGAPKGVDITHRNLLSLLNWAKVEYALTDFEILFSSTSYCFDLSVFEYLFPLILGKSIRILTDVSNISNYLEQESGIFINTVPSVVKALLEAGADFGNVTAINMAGEVIPAWIKEKLDFEKIEIRNLYGPSEDTTYSTCYRFKNDSHKNIPIGKPIQGTHLFIVDKDDNLVPKDVEGEICLTGESVARGYFNRPELTATSFVKNKLSGDYTLYKTGDLGKLLHDGEVEFIGRRDNQVKLRGFRIELGEIKSSLERINGVQQVEIVVLKEQLVCAWVGDQLNSDVLESRVSEELPSHFIPGHWYKLSEFPMNLNGKLDSKRLKAELVEIFHPKREFVSPSSEIEKALVGIWNVLFENENIGIRDDFFNLGGHSLIAIQLRHLIASQLSSEVSVEDIFSNSTIYELANLLAVRPKIVRNEIPFAESIETKYAKFWDVEKPKNHIRMDLILLGFNSDQTEPHEFELNSESSAELQRISNVLETNLTTVITCVIQNALWNIARVDLLSAQLIDTRLEVGNSISIYRFNSNDGIHDRVKYIDAQTSKFHGFELTEIVKSEPILFNDFSIISRDDSEESGEESEGVNTFLKVFVSKNSNATKIKIEMLGGEAAVDFLKRMENEIQTLIVQWLEELDLSIQSTDNKNNVQQKMKDNTPTTRDALDVDFNF